MAGKRVYAWQKQYLAAMLETDNTQLSERVHNAHTAIASRREELALDHGGTPDERRALSGALQRLFLLSNERIASSSKEMVKVNFRRSQALAGKVLNAQEEERRRIGRELHDDIVQRLALVSVALERLKNSLPAGMQTQSNTANTLFLDVQTIALDVQKLSRGLHPGALQHLGLEIAIRNLCHNIAEQHHIVVEFVSDDVKGLPADMNLCLFRVAQEALNNAVRHGEAKRIKVALLKEQNRLTLNVSDEGKGFDPSVASGGLGLLSMLERVRFLGGSVLVKSQVGSGTQVDAELPLSQPV